jgi:hypothetical protein
LDGEFERPHGSFAVTVTRSDEAGAGAQALGGIVAMRMIVMQSR